MSDIVSRLLLDSKQYDASLRKSKKESNDFASEVAGNLSVAVGKFAGAIGLAVGGIEAFEKLMGSSQTIGDKWNNTLNACKDTVDAFFFSLSSNNWSNFNQGLIRTIENMYQLSALRDDLSDARLSMGFETRQFEREFVRLEGIVDNDTKSNAERKFALSEMEALVADYKDRTTKTANLEIETLTKSMNAKFGRNDITIEDFKTYVREVNNKALKTSTLQDLEKYKATLDLFNDGRSRSVEGYGGLVMTKEQFQAANPFLEKMRLFEEDGNGSRQQMVEDYEYMLESIQRADEYFKRILEKQRTVAGLDVPPPPVAVQTANPYPGGALSSQRPNFASLASVNMGGLKTIPITQETVATTDDYVSSLNALSNVLTALNTQTVEGAAGWLSWAGSLMTASAMAVSAIRDVVEAKTAETAVKAASSAAETPFVGWLLVGGAVMSALAALAQIPSFAEGGVVPGANFRDGIAARLSSGEMVINPADQKKLFDSIHSGNLGGGGSARSVITGEQIVTVVNNYGRRTGRGTILKG